MKHMKHIGIVAASLATVVVFLGQPAPAHAATVPVANAAAVQTQKEAGSLVADKIALKELVDTFSILADQKDGIAQEPLFTKDAVVETTPMASS